MAAGRWKLLMGGAVSERGWARFDEFMNEWTFCHVLKAVNSDPNYPKVLGHLFGPAHEWFGMKVPASRCGGGDNPDTNYMIVPIDSHARFELQGQCVDPRPADAPFVVSGDLCLTSTLAGLDWQDLHIEPDGSFLITVGPQSASDSHSPNHIRTKPDSRYLYLRDVRSDWRQATIGYRIRRLDPPLAAPLTRQQMAERAALYMVEAVPTMYMGDRVFGNVPLNTVCAPFNTSQVGGLTSQMASFGRVRLGDEDAFVITIGPGAATYRSIVVLDYHWHHTFDSIKHTATLNNSQAVPNPDGSTTFVLARQDPGIHNWLDTVGNHEASIIFRWQAMRPDAGAAGAPWIRSTLVRLEELNRALPPGTQSISAQQREAQITERTQTFALRYIDR